MHKIYCHAAILWSLATFAAACLSGSGSSNALAMSTPLPSPNRPSRPPYGRASFSMMNTPDEIYNTYQPPINFYNITINETMSLPFQLFAVKFYTYPVSHPNAVAGRLITLIDSIDEYSLKTFCHHLPSEMLRNMVDIPSDPILKPQQQLVNLELFSRCAVHFGDSRSAYRGTSAMAFQIGLAMAATLGCIL